ncbi:MAG: carboxylating nicotinate-nucleotide diphosphorylase [Acidobacteria bacterium]|nr:carboxylating nicotinate-nucleotide diphosphorylase [Acidobacteriota bacterium]
MRPPAAVLVDTILRAALAEDLGRGGDLTTDAIVTTESRSSARIVARQPGRIAGLQIALRTFQLLSPEVTISPEAADGQDAEANAVLAQIEGPARALLTGERTALNFLGHLSGIATATHTLVAATAGTRAQVCDTRKTTPGLRLLEKYAVRCGGGSNHRMGLDDAVLIKDNHVALAGSVAEALHRARATVGHMVKIEIEVDTIAQLEEALEHGADIILLDNFDPSQLRAAVETTAGRALLEASGGIGPDTVTAVAAAGVDLISVGALTHSAPALDVSLEITTAESLLRAPGGTGAIVEGRTLAAGENS